MKEWELVPFHEAPFRINVKAEFRPSSEIHLVYQVLDQVHQLHWPEPGPCKDSSLRQQGLWEDTCFEFFIQEKKSSRYFEWNFSPTGAWNCFSFDDYRTPLPLQEAKVPTPRIQSSANHMTIDFKCQGMELGKFNITAVLKDKSDRVHYYALQHDFKGKPDFHNSGLFLSL